MGLGGVSVWQLLLIFVILVLAVVTIPMRQRGDAERTDGGADGQDPSADAAPQDAVDDEDEPGGADADPPHELR